MRCLKGTVLDLKINQPLNKTDILQLAYMSKERLAANSDRICSCSLNKLRMGQNNYFQL